MRKFLFSPSFLGSLFGVVGVIKTTRTGTRNYLIILQWISWALGVALAAGGIIAADRRVKNDQ